MCAKACTTTLDFWVESTVSVLMLGNVQRIVKIYNLYKSNLDYKIKSSLKTFNQINNQAEENTTTHKASSQIYILQYASTVNIHYFSYNDVFYTISS